MESKNIWTKYNSILNFNDKKTANALERVEGIEGVEWIGIEKIHGANFSIICEKLVFEIPLKPQH